MVPLREHLFISREYEIHQTFTTGGNELYISNKKAVSTLTLIILMLCAAVLGGIISYMSVIANFYLEPENTVGLVITEVNFPVDHADYFDITIMNPSHSPSGTNIAEIYFTSDGKRKNVTNTDLGELPIFLERGNSKTIRCFEKWGQFAGKTITVHVSATDASGAVRSVKTEYVKLEMEVEFDAAVSCKQFNLTIRNYPQSAINLTLTKVYINWEIPENIVLLPNCENATFPMSLPLNRSVSFQCFYDWESFVNPLVHVETLEGYYIEKRANATASILLLTTDVAFNETSSNEISVAILNSAESSTPVDITNIALAYDNKTDFINGSLVNPPLPYRLEKNKTVTFNCIWNWSNQSYRDINTTITAHTKQGFVSQSKTVRTPPQVVGKITDVRFDLDDTENFFVNVTNMPCSLHQINVTKIELDQNLTVMNYSIIDVGKQVMFNCKYNWTSFVGQNATITVHITYNENETSILCNLTLPYFKIRGVPFSNFSLGNSYVNITIYTSEFSTINATITQIFIETEGGTRLIDGTITSPKISPDGYELAKGIEITIVCPWDWNPYLGENVTVIVQTADGFQASKTVQVEQSLP